MKGYHYGKVRGIRMSDELFERFTGVRKGLKLQAPQLIEYLLDKIVEQKQETPREIVKQFNKPTLDEVKAYCTERKNNVDPSKFWNFYEAKNWFIGKSKMKNWQAAVRTWEKTNKRKILSI